MQELSWAFAIPIAKHTINCYADIAMQKAYRCANKMGECTQQSREG